MTIASRPSSSHSLNVEKQRKKSEMEVFQEERGNQQSLGPFVECKEYSRKESTTQREFGHILLLNLQLVTNNEFDEKSKDMKNEERLIDFQKNGKVWRWISSNQKFRSSWIGIKIRCLVSLKQKMRSSKW